MHLPRLTRKNAVAAVLIGGIIVCLIIMFVSVLRAGSIIPGYYGVKTDEDRLIFIRSFGWEVSADYTKSDVTIPAEFDSVYTEYNRMQIAQGLDLRKIAGRSAELYTYSVLNHPSGEENVSLNILVYKNKVVGGDVMSPRLDGFMHGFEMPASGE